MLQTQVLVGQVGNKTHKKGEFLIWKKPLNLRIEEIKKQITKIINESKLPAYILKLVMKDFYIQLENLEKAELIQAQKEYEENLKKEEK